MKTLIFVLTFIGFYALADYLGGLMPAWVGYAFLIGIIAALIALMVKLLGRVK